MVGAVGSEETRRYIRGRRYPAGAVKSHPPFGRRMVAAKFLARARILRRQHLGIPQRLHRREILGGLLVRFEGLATGGGPRVGRSHQFLYRDDIAAIDNPGQHCVVADPGWTEELDIERADRKRGRVSARGLNRQQFFFLSIA